MAGNNCHVLTITSSQGNLNVAFCMDTIVHNCLFLEMMLLLPKIVQLNGLALFPNGRGTYLLGPYFVGAWNERLLIALLIPMSFPSSSLFCILEDKNNYDIDPKLCLGSISPVFFTFVI